MQRNRGRLSEMKYSLAECGFAKIYSIAVSKEGSIPSSTHELMIVPCKSGIPPEHLRKTVRKVNEIMGAETEVISDRIMKYDRDVKELKVVKEERNKDQKSHSSCSRSASRS